MIQGALDKLESPGTATASRQGADMLSALRGLRRIPRRSPPTNRAGQPEARAGNACPKRHIRARPPANHRRSRIRRRPPLAPHARRRRRITAYERFCAGEPAVTYPACEERPHHDGQENAAADDDNGRACDLRRLARADGQRRHMARGALRLGDGFHPLLRDASLRVEPSLPCEVALGRSGAAGNLSAPPAARDFVFRRGLTAPPSTVTALDCLDKWNPA